MSKNNVKEISKYVFNQSQHYALRKLNVGVASVLIGTTMYVGLAHADTVPINNESTPIAQTSVPTTAQPSNSDNVTSSASDGGASVQAATGSDINRKVTSNTNTQQFFSTKVNQLSINSTNGQNENGLQTSLVQDTNNTDWTRNGYYQARASNVDFQLTQTYNNSADFPDETRVGFTGNVHFGVKTHFSLNTVDLKYGNLIYLGSMVFSNSLGDNSHNIPIAGVNWSNMGFVSYEGQRIGTVYCRQLDNAIVDWFISVTNNNNYVTPVITVSDWSDSDISAYNWDSSPLIYQGVPDNFDEYITMPGGKRYTFHMFNDISEAQGYNIRSLSVVGTHQFNWYDSSSPTLITNGGNSSENWTKEMLDSLNNVNGRGVVLPNTGYRQAYSYYPSNNQIVPSTVNVVFNVLPKDANNKLTYESVEQWGDGLHYERLSDGLSLVEIEQQCPEGHAVYSVQNDGSVLCYVYFAPSSLVMSESYITDYLKQHSKVIAIGGNKALQNTLDLYFGNALQGRTMQNLFSTAFDNSWSNYESLSVSDIKALDPDTGQVLAQCGNWHNVPDTLQFSVKPAIRVHYINGYNGQQIGNSQTFNDDQGKTLLYQAQNSLGAGYSLRRSGSHFLLNGQSLPSSYTLLDGSQTSSITYPKENTVSDVYYVIDPNPQQLVINYYDLSGKLVSSKTLSGYTDQRLSLSYLTPAGYVLATQSQPSSYQLGADHNELDLIVAPQVTVSTDSRTITRTINITRPDGSTYSVLQRAQFTRPQYTDTLTHVVSYGSWAMLSRFFAEYCPDIVDGYTVKSVSALKVLPTDTDSVVSVNYVKNPTVSAPKYVDVFGHEYVVLPTGYHAVAGQNQNQTGILIVKDVTPATLQSVEYVMRTVTIKLPNNHVRIIHQRVRKGTQFGKVAIPHLRGYKIVVSNNASLGRVTADQDMNLTVTFEKL